jgi:hypothetical protein
LAGSQIFVSGNGVTPTITSATPTQLVANFVITNGAARTSRQVSVGTAGGTSGNVAFKVN